MKIENKSPYKTEEIELSDYVSRELDGADADRGSLEELTATVDNIRLAFSRLVDQLVENGALPLKDVQKVIGGFTCDILSPINKRI